MNFRRSYFINACSAFLMLACAGCGDDVKTYRIAKDSEPSAQSMPAMPSMTPMPVMPSSMQQNTPSGMNGMSSSEGLPTPSVSPQEIKWKAPEGWKEQAPSSMRIGSFSIPAKNGIPTDVSVVPLVGEGGGDLSNINRWRGQISLEPVTEAQLAKIMEHIEVGKRHFHFVNFVSLKPILQNKFKQRLMAAYHHDGEKTWYFKMVGEDANVAAAKPQFLQLLSSVRFQSGSQE